jgi:hypothetical protein
MSAFEHLPSGQLAELLMSAAAQLAEPGPSWAALASAGIPIYRGRLHLGRIRSLLDAAEPVTVLAGFSTGLLARAPRGDGPEPGVPRLPQRDPCQCSRPGGAGSAGPGLARGCGVRKRSMLSRFRLSRLGYWLCPSKTPPAAGR